MLLNFKLHINDQARQIVRRVYREYGAELKPFAMYIDSWLSQRTHQVKCYVASLDDHVVSFALLSKCDFDPLKSHTNPWTLELICTLPAHRRKGYARQLLQHMQPLAQTTAFCCNAASVALFGAANYIDGGEYNHSHMFRSQA